MKLIKLELAQSIPATIIINIEVTTPTCNLVQSNNHGKTRLAEAEINLACMHILTVRQRVASHLLLVITDLQMVFWKILSSAMAFEFNQVTWAVLPIYPVLEHLYRISPPLFKEYLMKIPWGHISIIHTPILSILYNHNIYKHSKCSIMYHITNHCPLLPNPTI